MSFFLRENFIEIEKISSHKICEDIKVAYDVFIYIVIHLTSIHLMTEVTSILGLNCKQPHLVVINFIGGRENRGQLFKLFVGHKVIGRVRGVGPPPSTSGLGERMLAESWYRELRSHVPVFAFTFTRHERAFPACR